MSKWFPVPSHPPHHNPVLVAYRGTPPKQSERWIGITFWARTPGWGWTRGDGNKANDIFGEITHWREMPELPE